MLFFITNIPCIFFFHNINAQLKILFVKVISLEKIETRKALKYTGLMKSYHWLLYFIRKNY